MDREVTFGIDGTVARWHLKRTIANELQCSQALIDDLAGAMSRRAWLPDEIMEVRLAYAEAITNAMVHGNRQLENATVQIHLSCDPSQICIQIADQGPGFDPASIPDPRHEDLLEKPHGRGLLMMRNLMTEILYNDRGNQVTMIKQRGDSAAWDDLD